MDSFFLPAFRINLYFCQKHTPKAANFMFRLVLPVVKVPWWFLGVQYSFNLGYLLLSLLISFFIDYKALSDIFKC